MDYSPEIEQFLSYKLINQGRADSTIVKYRGYLQRLDRYLKVDQKLELFEADADVLDEFAGLYMYEEGLSPRSRQVLIAAVKGFYNWASKKGYSPINPSKNLEYPKAGKKLPSVMSLKTLESIIMAPRYQNFVGYKRCRHYINTWRHGFKGVGLMCVK